MLGCKVIKTFFTWTTAQKQCWLFSHHTSHSTFTTLKIQTQATYIMQRLLSFSVFHSTLRPLSHLITVSWKADQPLWNNLSKSHDYETHPCDTWSMGKRHLPTCLNLLLPYSSRGKRTKFSLLWCNSLCLFCVQDWLIPNRTSQCAICWKTFQ